MTEAGIRFYGIRLYGISPASCVFRMMLGTGISPGPGHQSGIRELRRCVD